MKKLIMTIAIVLGLGMSTFAQEEIQYEEKGLFGMGETRGNRDRLFGLVAPQDPYGEDNQDAEQPGPLGSGIAVLMGLGAAYMVAKKRKED